MSEFIILKMSDSNGVPVKGPMPWTRDFNDWPAGHRTTGAKLPHSYRGKDTALYLAVPVERQKPAQKPFQDVQEGIGTYQSNPDRWVIPASVKNWPVARIRTEMVSRAKQLAGLKILTILPEWKQRNLTAQAAELAMKKASGVALTADEQAAWDTGQAEFAKIKAVRLASDEIENAIAGMTVSSLQVYDLEADERWPADA